MGDAPPDSSDPSAAPPAEPAQASEPIPEGVAAVLRATRDPLIGATVQGYEVKARIGSGGMGYVYSGEQPMIGKRVAIKVLKPEMADKPGQVEALVSEARAVNRVGHRGIIDVFGFEVLPDGRQAIIMELLEGESLQDLIARNRAQNVVMPVGEVMLILEEVLSALGAAHGAGIIHRDMKPSNIFLCTQRGDARYVKLLDFGIAKLDAPDQASKANPSMIVGTPAYMAPEQAFKGKLTPAADLYAVGVIAFELLTNRLPFSDANLVELLYAHAEKPPPKPSDYLMSIPDEVDDLVLSLLQKKPEDRPQDANKVRMVVKRARKLLLHSTAHPELKLSRDKVTGKLVLEERASGERAALLPALQSRAPDQAAAGPPPAAAQAPPAAQPPPRASSSGGKLARARSVGAVPPRPSAPRKLATLEPGEVTVPSPGGAPPGKPDDATLVPGRSMKPPDVTFVPGRLQAVTEKQPPAPPPSPPTSAMLAPESAAGGAPGWLKAAVAAVVLAALAVGGWLAWSRLRPGVPAQTVIEEIPVPPPGGGAPPAR